MLKFKKQFENQTVVLADGTLIDKQSISSDYVQSRLTASPWFAYMLEPAEVKAETPKAGTPKAPEVKAETPKAETPKRRSRK